MKIIVEKFARLLIRFYYNGILQSVDNVLMLIRMLKRGRKNIRKFKDIHKNERCFIVATGPSLTFDDLNLLKNEVTFSMNSIVKVFDQTKWRPTYFGIQDIDVYEKIKDDINFNGFVSFISERLGKQKKISNAEYFSLHLLNHRYYRDLTPTIKFSSDASVVVYDGFSITFSLLQIAVYMGFSEIYLLGCDCNYSAKSGVKNHFVEHGHLSKDADSIGEKMIATYVIAKEYADKHNIKIYNATRGGKLEIFPRVKLENLVS